MEKIVVVVSCYKKDYFLARVCIASLKYFHPDAEVYLLKDYLAGDFDSTELENAFQVKLIDLGKREYGWGAAKVHFILSEKFAGQRVFLIDSDTVFVGKFLAGLYQKTQGIDFVVSPEYYATPYEGNVPLHYYSFDGVKEFDPTFIFPGYVFNTGHLIVTPGKLTDTHITNLFDINKFPYYKRLDIMHQVDQSLLNYILPKLAQEGTITLAKDDFMLWSDGKEAAALDLRKVKEGTDYPFLIHWAGVLRISHLAAMTRADILLFFEDYYYTRVPMGALKKSMRRALAASNYHLRSFYRKRITPLMKRS